MQALKEAKMQRSQAKKAGNQPLAVAAGGALTNLNMPTDAQKNQGYYEALMDAINTILKCPKFVDIQVAEPLAIKDGVGAASGVQAMSSSVKDNYLMMMVKILNMAMAIFFFFKSFSVKRGAWKSVA